MSGCLVLAVDVEDLQRGASAHEVAVVAAAGVVADEPGVGFGLELTDAGETAAMEGGTPALLQRGPLEPFAHGVVVGRPGRYPPVADTFGRHRGRERPGNVFGAVVGQDGLEGEPEASVTADDLREDEGGDTAGGRTD